MAAANENQWREFWQRLGADGSPLPPWQRLHTAYTESWRAYHNLDHIGHCLAELAAVRQLADDPIALEAAVWFHDVIYDTRRKDNEERSAGLADVILQDAGKPNNFRGYVHTLILATKHESQPTSSDTRLWRTLIYLFSAKVQNATPNLSSKFAANTRGCRTQISRRAGRRF